MAIILANMHPLQRKSLASYIRLLRLFETHLKDYHSVFDNDYYKIQYIIQRERYSNDAYIKVIFTILRNPFWKLLVGENENVKVLLENYSRYFSVTDITIVRPLSLKHGKREKKSVFFQIQPIEERVTFDLFMHESRRRVIE